MKKEEKAFFLFEELSGVSEERLEEARLYGIRRRNLQRFRRSLAVLAAALAVSYKFGKAFNPVFKQVLLRVCLFNVCKRREMNM